ALIFGEDICNQIPGCVGEFIPLCHLGLLALMAVYFTENRISWVYVQSLVPVNGVSIIERVE
ncbi:hypothetical protein, partial [Pseudomonas lundensis]|uniref:hypothetical protein n=1 Tax=Pseudomonas lundensis TaxID=86185 RepID=UPI001CB71612